MKKRYFTPFLLGSSFLFFTLSAAGQRKPDDPKHENHYGAVTVDSEEMTLEIPESHSQQEFTLLKLKVTNKTNDYIFLKGAETIFKYEFGEFKPTGGGMFQSLNLQVLPKEVETKTLKLSGGGKNYHVQNLTFIPNGFYRVSSEGKVAESPDFKLPLASNDVVAGNFKCTVDKLDKETKETKITFKCAYRGNDVGILDPTKMVVRLKSGQEFVNDNHKSKAVLMVSGDEEKIVATFHVPGKTEDMQFNNMDIVWKNTFSESKMVPIKLKNADLVLDPGKTEGKNK
jgi:hypothetical protein